MKVYGLKNCDTVKKALHWFDENAVKYEFHDIKKEGVTQQKIKTWEKQVGWEALLNKKGTTFRKLTDEEKQVNSATAAVRLMAQHPSAIKRPIIEIGEDVVVGFDEKQYTEKFK